MCVTSLLCSPRADIWRFYGFLGKRFSLYIQNFACKRWSVGNTTSPRAKMLLFPMSLFCYGGFSFNWENVIFAAYFVLRGRDMHIDFSAVIVSGRRNLPSDTRTFIAAKKAHQSRARRRHVKVRGAVYKRLFKSNRVLRADKRRDVNQTYQQSVFSPIRACIRIWCTAGAVDWWNDGPKWLSVGSHPFPSLPLRFFDPFPRQRACSQAKIQP